MSSSEVQICNLALLKFGDLFITSIDNPTTREERICQVLYPQMRDELTAEHPWNFALTRADISAQLSTTPSFEWDYAYTLPANCLRVVELYGATNDWVIEGNELLTNQEEEIYIKYIARITETGNMPPAYVRALSSKLGAELATRLADDKRLRRELLLEHHEVDLPNAQRLNAIEGQPPRSAKAEQLSAQTFSWQTEGR